MCYLNDISIVFAGAAGQGIQTTEDLCIKIFKRAGYNVFATREFMSRVRGGLNSTQIRISNERKNSYVHRIDVLVSLKKGALERLKNRIDNTLILSADGQEEEAFEQTIVPFGALAKQAGSIQFENSVAAGIILAIMGIERNFCIAQAGEFFADKKPDENVQALISGYEYAEENRLFKKYFVETNDSYAGEPVFDGSTAVALGAVNAGCGFIAAYPMAPATGVLTLLAQNSRRFGIVFEQAEDELSAVNMTIGAWYAGARAMTTTSGGGFTLMCEAISMAGIAEIPLVIHLAQRPGPATGMATRTEQGDLNLALYAGHGEFPRIILSPGSVEEAFDITQNAFDLADKFQVPVIILTDHYLINSMQNVKEPVLKTLQSAVVDGDTHYQRYLCTDTGISPRAVPGKAALVGSDSHEHDEDSHITEQFSVRIKMHEKRMKKVSEIKQNTVLVELYGEENFKNLIICWGSLKNIVFEALDIAEITDTAVVHFSQIYPFPDVGNILEQAEHITVVEGNYAGQFADLILRETAIEADARILKYSGECFSPEEIAEQLKELYKGGANA